MALLQLLLLKVTNLYTISQKIYNSIQDHIKADNNKTKKCSGCGNNKSKTFKYNSPPCFQMIGFTENSQDIDISKKNYIKFRGRSSDIAYSWSIILHW